MVKYLVGVLLNLPHILGQALYAGSAGDHACCPVAGPELPRVFHWSALTRPVSRTPLRVVRGVSFPLPLGGHANIVLGASRSRSGISLVRICHGHFRGFLLRVLLRGIHATRQRLVILIMLYY